MTGIRRALAAGALWALTTSAALPAAHAAASPPSPDTVAVMHAATAVVEVTVRAQVSVTSRIIDRKHLATALDRARRQMPTPVVAPPWEELVRLFMSLVLEQAGDFTRPGPPVDSVTTAHRECAGWFITPDGFLLTAGTCLADAAADATAKGAAPGTDRVVRDLLAAMPADYRGADLDRIHRQAIEQWIRAGIRVSQSASARVTPGGGPSGTGHHRTFAAKVLAVDSDSANGGGAPSGSGKTEYPPTATSPQPTRPPPAPVTDWATDNLGTGAALLKVNLAQASAVSAVPPVGVTFPSDGQAYVAASGARSAPDDGLPQARALDLGQKGTDGSRWLGEVDDNDNDSLVPGTPVMDPRGQPIGLVTDDGHGQRRVSGGSAMLFLVSGHDVEARPGRVTQAFTTGLTDFRRAYYSRARDSFRSVLRLQPDHPTAGTYLRRCDALIRAGGDETPHSRMWWATVSGIGLAGFAGWQWARRRRREPVTPPVRI